jgi:hypothetical protein
MLSVRIDHRGRPTKLLTISDMSSLCKLRTEKVKKRAVEKKKKNDFFQNRSASKASLMSIERHAK